MVMLARLAARRVAHHDRRDALARDVRQLLGGYRPHVGARILAGGVADWDGQNGPDRKKSGRSQNWPPGLGERVSHRTLLCLCFTPSSAPASPDAPTGS